VDLKESHKMIAVERIERLLSLAERKLGENQDLARRYVELAWKLKLRYRVRLSPELKRKFCRKCKILWKPGVSCRVRIRSGRVTIICLRCGHITRIPLRPKKNLGFKNVNKLGMEHERDAGERCTCGQAHR